MSPLGSVIAKVCQYIEESSETDLATSASVYSGSSEYISVQEGPERDTVVGMRLQQLRDSP